MEQSNFQFSNPILTKLSYDINSKESDKEYEQFKDIQTQVKIDNSNIEKFNANVSLNLKMGTEYTPFVLNIEMQSNFKWNDEFSKSEVDTLLNQNAPALLLSYMRPIISEITGYGFNSFMLPFIDFSKNNKDK